MQTSKNHHKIVNVNKNNNTELVYELLSPNSPFADLDEGLTISNILSGEYEMPDCLTEYKNLISKCLEKDPLKRPSWKEIYQMLDEIDKTVG